MATVKRIVCLANSRKLSGRCVAGREWDGKRAGVWIRPVSAREHEEVSEKEREYEDGSDPRLLDIIDVPLIEPRPKTFQQENWLLDDQRYWVRAGRLSWNDLAGLEDRRDALWINGHNTGSGLNDRIPLEEATPLRSSLRLLRVPKIELRVFAPGEAFGNRKRRVQGHFEHLGTQYGLWATDPLIERTYLAKQDGTYRLGESYLTVSLGEPHDGYCYKLVAAIISR